ncbi:hypothetical protein BH09ACT12_BH09ACT12_34080 [soil metagenome]
MNDRSIFDELTRAADAQSFSPADPQLAIRSGGRARRRRTLRSVLAVTAVVTVKAALVATRVAGGSTNPSTAFGDPGDRVLLVAAGGPADGYPDMVVRASGGSSVTIEGFGWPLDDMAAVSDSTGQVSFPEISKVDAETMCLPMLNQAAPQVPDTSWEHAGYWIDGFPSRAGLVASYQAEQDGRIFYAHCTLTGCYNPDNRPDLPRVPAASATADVLRQCSYQGHIDFGAWQVGAVDRAADTLAAVLVSPGGYVARCVLSSDEEQRVTQLSGTTVEQTSASDPMFYGGDDTATLTLAGVVGPDVDRVEVSSAGSTRSVAVTAGTYAAVVPVPGRVPAGHTVVTTLDAQGVAVATYRGDGLLPILCFTSVETDNDGC